MSTNRPPRIPLRPGLRIVSSINVAAARKPELRDYDEVDEQLEVTAELPTYETLYRTVFEDLGGCTAELARRRAQ